jgi:hypothetical protein
MLPSRHASVHRRKLEAGLRHLCVRIEWLATSHVILDADVVSQSCRSKDRSIERLVACRLAGQRREVQDLLSREAGIGTISAISAVFCVSVPVLSEQSTSMAAASWTADRLVSSAPLRLSVRH